MDMNFDLDFEALHQGVMDAAITHLEEKDDCYIQGWLEGVNFTCFILTQIMERRENIKNFTLLPYRNNEIH